MTASSQNRQNSNTHASKHPTLATSAEERHKDTELPLLPAQPRSSYSADTPNTLAQFSGIIQRCSGHMDSAIVQHKAVVALFHKTTWLSLLSNHSTPEVHSLMKCETEITWAKPEWEMLKAGYKVFIYITQLIKGWSIRLFWVITVLLYLTWVMASVKL